MDPIVGVVLAVVALLRALGMVVVVVVNDEATKPGWWEKNRVVPRLESSTNDQILIIIMTREKEVLVGKQRRPRVVWQDEEDIRMMIVSKVSRAQCWARYGRRSLSFFCEWTTIPES